MNKFLEKKRDLLVKKRCDFCKREERHVTNPDGKLSGIQAYEWECRAAMKEGFNAACDLHKEAIDALIEADEYLTRDDGVSNYIGSKSILHCKIRKALKNLGYEL